MKAFLSGWSVFILILTTTYGATIHVDANAADGGDGSAELPFKLFGNGLNVADNDDTILVRGGEGQIYDDYPYNIWQTNLSVAATGSGKPLFQVTGASVVVNTGVFNVSAPQFKMTGLQFYGNSAACGNENSAMIWLTDTAGDAIFDSNHFEWDTSNTIKMGSAIRVADGADNVVVRDNIVKNFRYQYSNNAVFSLKNYAVVVGNLFANTQTAVTLGSYCQVVSNTVINSNCENGSLSRGGYGSGKSATVAYNVIYQNNGKVNPVIQKNRESFGTASSMAPPTRIFNNTVAGASSLIRCDRSDVHSSTWEPLIVNNIAYCTSTNIVDVSTIIDERNYDGQTVFGPGTIIQNNLLISDLGVIFEERVTPLCADNVFNNSDHRVTFLETENYHSEKYFVPGEADLAHINAGYGTPENGYATWIGARPGYTSPGTILMIY